MRVSREQAAENRERVLSAAAKLFRERGFDGIGVADLMKSAGLTHGGFYGQFESKEDLMAQAAQRAMQDSLAHWQRLAERAPQDPLAALLKFYLSPAHRDRPGEGCMLASLGAEAPRHGPALRHSFTTGCKALLEQLAGMLPGRSATARRERALATFASMVGALVLARAVDDDGLSRDILHAVSASAGAAPAS